MKIVIALVGVAALCIEAPCAAATVDGFPSFDQATDSGLYVWRSWDGRWHLRLMGSNHFSGELRANRTIESVERLSLEPNDLTQSTNNRLSLDLTTVQGNVDGVIVDADGSRLCLTSNPDSTVDTVFLGGDAVVAQLPVELTGSGSCAKVGLALDRVAKMDWQARLRPEQSYDTFAGRFEISEPLVSYDGVSLEQRDLLYLSAPNELSFSLGAAAGFEDGVNFSVPEFAKVCLREASGAPEEVLLGSSTANPIMASTPVDLTNNGACGLPADPFPPPTYGKKFNPGHYVTLMRRDDSQSIMTQSIRPGVRGVMKRYLWRELEPEKGSYNFWTLRTDLEFLAGNGLQLVAMIEDKTFAGGEMPTPDYLYDRTLPNRAGGFTVARWDPEVVARLTALIDVLAARFDNHPNFEGIALQESALGIDQPTLDANGYTPELYRDALVQTLTSGAASLQQSRVFWYMNFLTGGNYYMGDVLRAVAPHGVIMGGPDVLPDDFALQRHAYPHYQYAVGNMPIFTQVEGQCYAHLHTDTSYTTRFWTPAELFEFARDNLFVSYVFWQRVTFREFSDSYNWFDALPVIAENPMFNE